jgi:hypothetical protein
MYIAFSFAHKETDVWSTPLSLVKEFERLGHNVRIYSLFDKDGNYTEAGLKQLWEEMQAGMLVPSMFIHMDWTGFQSEYFQKINSYTNIFTVFESADDPQNYYRNSPKAKDFNLVLTPDHSCYLKYKEAGHNTQWFTHWTDTEIFKPSKIEPSIPVVSTRGLGGSQFLDYLCDVLGDKFHNKNGWVGKAHAGYLSYGKIVLVNSRWQEITRRVMEATSIGRLVIADRLPEETKIQELYVDGEDIIYYDNLTYCISKINYYLNNHSELSRIAQNGMNKTLQHHTQVQRVQQILRAYEQNKR